MQAVVKSVSVKWVIGLALIAANVARADPATAIARLQNVGPKGADNEAAAQAWQELVAGDVARLPTIISGLDAAGPLGLNYLRSAVEALADRALKAGQSLPVAELEKLVRDTSHKPRTRRLAFEILVRGDATATERLVPTFIDDPSVELRRDAVARLMAQAAAQAREAKDEAAQKAAAVALYRQALNAARDLDQVEELAKVLEKLGEKVDLPTHFGFVMHWRLLGPFDNAGEKAFDVAYPPESEINLAASYPGKNEGQKVSWIEHTTTDSMGKVDLNKALGKANGVVGYALAEFVAADARAVELRLGCICANKVWLNGEPLGGHKVYHSGARVDQYVFPGKLRPGKNLILLKILQNEQTETWAQDWDFQLRVCDATGTAILSQASR